ncbi:hypothetical protein CBS9595_000657 [Malassezia furfur]|nr:hypothetical protein CBS9595_000657 [Malassezia furfur]
MQSIPLPRLLLWQRSHEQYTLPIRVRPAILGLNVLVLVLLGLLGFHPSAQGYIYVNDKVMHFFGFMLASFLCYMIWDLDESVRRISIWRYTPLAISFVASIVVGAIGSEFVQSLLPYKTFQLGDILANLAGSSIGLYVAYHVERRYRANREIEPLYAPLGTGMRPDEDAYEVNDWDASSVDHAPERSNGTWLDEPYESASGQVVTESVFQLDDDEIDN